MANMRILRIAGVVLMFSLFFVIIVYLGYVWARLWAASETAPKEKFLPVPSVEKTTRSVMRVPKNKFLAQLDSGKKRRSAGVPYVMKRVLTERRSSTKPTEAIQVIINTQGSPRFPNIYDAVLELDSTKYCCNDSASSECVARTETFGDLLQKELNRVVTYESRVFRSGLDKHNAYDVHFDGAYGKRRSREELRCRLGGVRVRTVTGRDAPLAARGLEVPAEPLQQGKTYGTCAVVASSGSLLGSRHGKFIDSHDMVLRFNNAPTVNFTEDVGSKTTFRILNSQIVTKPEYNFLEDPLYSNISIIIWDPAHYAASLENWSQSPDYPVFDFYKRYLELNPGADVHLLKPEVLWELWNVLQSSATNRLRRNPPSSGFIGLWFAMQRCVSVSMIEYLPSTRATERCHYYAQRRDRACTLGSWHPLAQEKLLANLIRDNSNFEAYQRGFINIPGIPALNCPE